MHSSTVATLLFSVILGAAAGSVPIDMDGAFHVPHITNLFGCSPSLIILADLLAHSICLIVPQV